MQLAHVAGVAHRLVEREQVGDPLPRDAVRRSAQPRPRAESLDAARPSLRRDLGERRAQLGIGERGDRGLQLGLGLGPLAREHGQDVRDAGLLARARAP